MSAESQPLPSGRGAGLASRPLSLRGSGRRARRRAFTLVEMLMVLAIVGLLGVGLYQFTMDTSLLVFLSTAKLEMNADMRQVTNELAERARQANEFYVYRTYQPGALALADRVGEGESGDCLVLIYQEPRNPATGILEYGGPTYIQRLVVYYREAPTEGVTEPGPVRTFTLSYPGAAARRTGAVGNSPEELVNSFSGTPQTVVELAKGLAESQLFYRLNRESILVRAEIFHGNLRRQVTNTYNFTISPRG